MINSRQEFLIKETVQKYSPTLVGIFGSYARNEQRPESDLDILIEFEKNLNLIEIIGLEQELSALLGVKVDLVTMKSVHNGLQCYIQQDLIRIL